MSPVQNHLQTAGIFKGHRIRLVTTLRGLTMGNEAVALQVTGVDQPAHGHDRASIDARELAIELREDGAHPEAIEFFEAQAEEEEEARKKR